MLRSPPACASFILPLKQVRLACYPFLCTLLLSCHWLCTSPGVLLMLCYACWFWEEIGQCSCCQKCSQCILPGHRVILIFTQSKLVGSQAACLHRSAWVFILVWSAGERHRESVLQNIAVNLEGWTVQTKQETAIYHTLNKLSVDTSRKVGPAALLFSM